MVFVMQKNCHGNTACVILSNSAGVALAGVIKSEGNQITTGIQILKQLRLGLLSNVKIKIQIVGQKKESNFSTAN